MSTPMTLSALPPRGMGEIASAAHAVQANLVALRVAYCRLTGLPVESHDIKTPPPGPVRKMRDFLIDRHIIKGYSPEEILLRIRQVWGEFCALCWLFPNTDPQQPIAFDPLPSSQSIRCPMHVQDKLEEVQKRLWRIRHEMGLRQDQPARHDPSSQRDHELALSIPLRIQDVAISECTDADLFCAACEYAGMLAALRWSADSRWGWESPGIMEVMVHPSS